MRVTQTNWQVERDAAATLRTLQRRGYRLGAVSNGSDDWNALELLERGRLRSVLRDGPDLGSARSAQAGSKHLPGGARPLPRGSAELAVMIGDSYEADILGAGALGIRTIWITKTSDRRRRCRVTCEPDAIVPTLREIPALLG